MKANSTPFGDSPLRLERLKRGLTIGAVAQRTGLSKTLVCLAEQGTRRAPTSLLLFIMASGAEDLGAQQEAWRQAHGLGRTSGPTFTFRCSLPAGITVEEARQRCAEALAEFVAEGAR